MESLSFYIMYKLAFIKLLHCRFSLLVPNCYIVEVAYFDKNSLNLPIESFEWPS